MNENENRPCEMPDGPKGICLMHLRCVRQLDLVNEWHAFGGTFATGGSGAGECVGCYEGFEDE